MSKPVAVVIGVGPGLGGALARRWSKEGYAVVAISRTLATAQAAVAGLEDALALSCDATDADQTAAAIAQIRSDVGTVQVLLYNAGGGVRGRIEDISAGD
ncbi:MAG: SDR family NAD(P)-dependent oxidoreductase, partial [Alphaproteobacteria bacterium]|nr:SDR family NAD(P)-dependent oxidoreductase [Alphaproteobacteria bacterium]